MSSDLATYELLRKLVARFTNDEVLRQDLFQECLLCLWRVESERPGQTRSWYLQHCLFRMQHWLAAGRSVDSPKRARGDRRITIEGDGEDILVEYHTNGELFEAVSFQDVVSTLDQHLKGKEKAVLHGLADGLVLREVAVKYELSYPTALKYRRKIAGLTMRLGIAPASPASAAQTPGKKKP